MILIFFHQQIQEGMLMRCAFYSSLVLSAFSMSLLFFHLFWKRPKGPVPCRQNSSFWPQDGDSFQVLTGEVNFLSGQMRGVFLSKSFDRVGLGDCIASCLMTEKAARVGMQNCWSNWKILESEGRKAARLVTGLGWQVWTEFVLAV